MTTINRKLNIVIPVERDDGSTVYVHGVPIGPEIIDEYWLVLAQTFEALATSGLSRIVAPKVSARMLRRVAEQQGVWEGDAGVENGLMNTIRRLTNILMPVAGKGFIPMAWQDVVDRHMLAAEDISGVENALVYFTLASSTMNRSDFEHMVAGSPSIIQLWGAATTSLPLMDYGNSLRTSTETETSDEKTAAL